VKAIISDIHGNLEALLAVLDEIDRVGFSVVYNLGDMTGYGPNPLECIDVSMHRDVVLKGNFDQAVLVPPDAFGVIAERTILWTRRLLDSTADNAERSRRCMEFLGKLDPCYRDGEVLYVHGSPRNPLHEYVFPEDIYNSAKMTRIGSTFEHLCFCGHTHKPGIFVENSPGQWQFLSPRDCGNIFQLDGRKVLCNVGSVGQPRDGDWRAGFVMFDGSAIAFHRVEYDIETTIKKIYAQPELDSFCGDRLREGH
jgi:diadenosine tetraphosphatase ApaH/serine/threonine PP2A family protein phosphatase